MRSMTGYRRASPERDGRELTLELKTVNHRFLDLNIRLPRALLFLEDGMRKGLTRVSRAGMSTCSSIIATRVRTRAR